MPEESKADAYKFDKLTAAALAVYNSLVPYDLRDQIHGLGPEVARRVEELGRLLNQPLPEPCKHHYVCTKCNQERDLRFE